MWGKKKENGLWLAPKTMWRFMFRNHDALFLAMWRFRFRLMKPISKR